MEKDAVAEREVGSFRQSRCSGCLRRLPFPIHARSLTTTQLPDSRLKPLPLQFVLLLGLTFNYQLTNPGPQHRGPQICADFAHFGVAVCALLILRVMGWKLPNYQIYGSRRLRLLG